MANNAYYGYTPKKEEISAGSTGNRLDRINPYEFRKGMDYELTGLGCSRLAESSVEEREKATESVLKNLEENHPAYYSGLIQYETEYRGRDKKPTFKQWIKEFYEENNMKEVGDTFKNDKMEELKETIKSKVRKMILENDELMDDETELDVDGIPVVDLDNDVDDVKEEEDEEAIAKKTAVKGAKGKAKQLKALDKEEAALGKEKERAQTSFEKPLAKYKDGKLTSSEYTEQTKELTDRIKEINDRLKEIETERDEVDLAERLGRREVAKSMMEKATHLEILNIIKEAGISLHEGSDGVKAYYEIAKTAYQEGFMAGLHKNN